MSKGTAGGIFNIQCSFCFYVMMALSRFLLAINLNFRGKVQN